MEKAMNIVVATDGSEAAIDAARQSMDLLRPGAHVVLVMVIPEYEDPMEDAGGIEGPAISYERAEKDWKKATADGQSALDRTAASARTKGGGASGSRRRNSRGGHCPSRPRDQCRRARGRLFRQGLVGPSIQGISQRLRGAPRSMSGHADPPRPLSAEAPVGGVWRPKYAGTRRSHTVIRRDFG